MENNNDIVRPFRIQTKNFSLTYSNVEQQGWIEFTKEALSEFLISRNGVSYVVVSKEEHQDGNTHFHALVQFKKKKDLRNNRYFDFSQCHPNIQATESVAAWTRYIKKDGDFIEEGARDEDVFALCGEMEKRQFVNYCITQKIGFAFMELVWSTMHPSRSLATIEKFTGGGTMCPDIAFFRYDDFRAKVLVLEGPTGCGKTTWALKHAPKPTLIINHQDMLRKEFDPTYHKSIIFDDMSFTHMPREAQLHLVEQRYSAQVHCRYAPAIIPPGTVKIFTCNIYPFSPDPTGAIQRRIHHKVIVDDATHRIAAVPDDLEVIEL